jgi:hypothetical protein
MALIDPASLYPPDAQLFDPVRQPLHPPQAQARARPALTNPLRR